MNISKAITKKNNISKLLLSIGMALYSLIMLAPFAWMISASFKPEMEVFNYPIEWIPRHWNLVDNYYTVIVRSKFFVNYYNSVLYSAGTVVLCFIVTSMCAYAFSKIRFRFRDQLFLGYLSLMMIPPQLTLVPRFMIIMTAGLYDTLTALILMEAFSIYGVFLLRQFMITIPDSICESAKIDGASHFQTYTRIVFPMIKPALATLGILKFVWSWNDYQNPLIFLKTKLTIQLGVQQFAANDGLSPIYSLVMAASVLATIPIIIVYIIFQKYVVEGMTVGAVKG
jgi:multiple sugar transport system permease protein